MLEDIATLSKELEAFHGLSAAYETDVQELKLREQRMAKVPAKRTHDHTH